MPTIKAIYENGVFRPQEPFSAAEGTIVDIPVPAAHDSALQAKIAEFKRLHPDTFGVIDRETADELWSIIERDCRRQRGGRRVMGGLA